MNQVVANVTVIFCVAACIAGGIFAWWVENRPEDRADTDGHAEKKDKDADQGQDRSVKESKNPERKPGKKKEP